MKFNNITVKDFKKQLVKNSGDDFAICLFKNFEKIRKNKISLKNFENTCHFSKSAIAKKIKKFGFKGFKEFKFIMKR